MTRKYTMKLTRSTVDKLGVRLYDKVSAVIAELLSNSYDADATTVWVTAPMGEYLARSTGSKGLQDSGYEIVVRDNGVGMVPDEMQDFFLLVGADRRADSKRGDLSRKFSRKVMGKKGVGKLAPFGVCKQIEVLSAGGDKLLRKGRNGAREEGYLASHLVLDYDDITKDDDGDYHPKTGTLDGTLRSERGTTITLRSFYKRRVPDAETMARQIAQRFGIRAPNWKVVLEDATQTPGSPAHQRSVGSFDVATMDGTRLTFDGPEGPTVPCEHGNGYVARNADGTAAEGFAAGFVYEDHFYPVKGWLAYAKQSYRDELMAGVRVYCRGKIAAQTALFNKKSGFHGEHSVRSYFVGELFCDWLDEVEDLIHTDRRDILWSHDLGQAFEQWGQALVTEVGRRARDPMRRKARDLFHETGQIKDRAQAAFPQPEQRDIRERAVKLADMFGRTLREDEAKEREVVDPIVELSIDLAPHLVFEEKLREAADAADTPMGVIGTILRAAQLAELYSFGRIANDRVRVIERVEALKDEEDTVEAELQQLIESAPWLIDPQWAPITANESLHTLRLEFEKHYEERTGDKIALRDFTETSKRPDFVTFSVGERLHVVEIKRPKHRLTNDEMERLNTYYREMKAFLDDPAHRSFRDKFHSFRITLVCDEVGLKGANLTAFEQLCSAGHLVHQTWSDFLARTRIAHAEFLAEARRQKRDAAHRA